MSQNGNITSSPVYKKIVKMYNNYGIDATDMEDDELEWLISQYISDKEKLDRDFKNSEVHKDKFEDLI